MFLIGLSIFFTEYTNIVSDPDGRRWGDKLAGTKVVDLNPGKTKDVYLIVAMLIMLAFILVPAVWALHKAEFF